MPVKRGDEMKKYKISMKTPIGVRYGTMEVCIYNQEIEGGITLLGHKKPINGMIDSTGSCTIVGQLTTLVRNINYTAVGKITDTEIELSLKGERNVFKITGTVEKKEEND